MVLTSRMLSGMTLCQTGSPVARSSTRIGRIMTAEELTPWRHSALNGLPNMELGSGVESTWQHYPNSG